MPRRRRPHCAVIAACALQTAFAAGCGYVGDPRPPALNIPQTIQDLRGIQRGSKLLLEATLPKLTTEGVGIEKLGDVDVRVGVPQESGFEVNAWAASAKRVTQVTIDHGLLHIDAPVGEFAGKEVFVAVRSAHLKGRWSGWSNVLVINVQKPLATPSNIKPESSAEGVRLTWAGDSPNYRVYRESEGETAFRQIGETTAPEYSDSTAAYGKAHSYQLQGFRKTGDRIDESEPSSTVPFTPIDTFPPAVPQGLSVLLGVGSVELAWERVLDKDLRGYYVYRAVGDGPFERISGVLEVPSLGDKKIEPGKTYRYAVSSVDHAGNESARSEPVTQTVTQ